MDDEPSEKLLAKHFEQVKERAGKRLEDPDCLGYARLLRVARGDTLAPPEASHLAACETCQRLDALFRTGLAEGWEQDPQTDLQAQRPDSGSPSWRARARTVFAGKRWVQPWLRRQWRIPALAAAALVLLGILVAPRAKLEYQFAGLCADGREGVRMAEQGRRLPENPLGVSGAPAVTRGGSAAQIWPPHGAAFLPTDSIEFRLTGALVRQLRVDGRPVDGPGPHPVGRWTVGEHDWEADGGVGGRFVVLGERGRQLARMAGDRLRSDPALLAMVYYELGLFTHSLREVERIPDVVRRGQLVATIPHRAPAALDR